MLCALTDPYTFLNDAFIGVRKDSLPAICPLLNELLVSWWYSPSSLRRGRCGEHTWWYGDAHWRDCQEGRHQKWQTGLLYVQPLQQSSILRGLSRCLCKHIPVWTGPWRGETCTRSPLPWLGSKELLQGLKYLNITWTQDFERPRQNSLQPCLQHQFEDLSISFRCWTRDWRAYKWNSSSFYFDTATR